MIIMDTVAVDSKLVNEDFENDRNSLIEEVLEEILDHLVYTNHNIAAGQCQLRFRTDIFKEGVNDGSPGEETKRIKLCRNMTELSSTDSGILESSSSDSQHFDPPDVIVPEDVPSHCSISSSGASSDCFLAEQITTSTPWQAGGREYSLYLDPLLDDDFDDDASLEGDEVFEQQNVDDLRKQLLRKRKFEDNKDTFSITIPNDRITLLTNKIEETQGKVREIERISKLKIAKLDEEIAAAKSEIKE